MYLIESYKLVSEEYDRLKSFRIEIERVLSAHSLHIDDDIIQKISNPCLDIKALETRHKTNLLYDELIESTNSERTGVFGLNEITKIYENLLTLIK
ncbi:MAG: hypothetical protein KAQ75_03245 [Bacteroidales bacterium]|nr:hypothetical protein [Bacteroidales bacterium]